MAAQAVARVPLPGVGIGWAWCCAAEARPQRNADPVARRCRDYGVERVQPVVEGRTP
jgi:hypothetical protein